MRGGHVDAVSRVSVSGWAADAAEPLGRLELSVFVNGAECGRVTAQRLRRDLEALGRYGDGAHGFIFSFPQPLPPDIDCLVRVCFADSGDALPNGERLVPAYAASALPAAAPELAKDAGVKKAAPSPPPDPVASMASADLAPVLVTAPGRSGTTYLMSCLAASADIAVAELVPYEVRLLSYYAAAFGVLTAPGNIEKSTHPDRLEGDGFHIGFNPFTSAQYNLAFKRQAPLRDLIDLWAPGKMAAAFADIVREYYARLGADQNKTDLRYFAEKNNNLHQPSRAFVRRAFPGMREIVIVRDPRDVLCSHMAYFTSSEDKAFHQLTHSCRLLLGIAREAKSDTIVIRYEDMINGGPECFAGLSRFLGASVAPIASSVSSNIFNHHATSDTPSASIGRWKSDLSGKLAQQVNSEWKVFLDHFGYEID